MEGIIEKVTFKYRVVESKGVSWASIWSAVLLLEMKYKQKPEVRMCR